MGSFNVRLKRIAEFTDNVKIKYFKSRCANYTSSDIISYHFFCNIRKCTHMEFIWLAISGT